jgi:hypothetical protein
MLANIQNYDDRISAGKRVEHAIITGLRNKGFRIEDPTSNQDMHQKIDGWWIDKKDNKYSLQVKFRQSGDDILFELMRDVDRNIEGRDLKSEATLYLVADRSGVTRMFLTKPIKEKAYEILKNIFKDLQTEPRKTNWEGPSWQARIQYDRANGAKKIVAYFDPRMFKTLGSWNLNLH